MALNMNLSVFLEIIQPFFVGSNRKRADMQHHRAARRSSRLRRFPLGALARHEQPLDPLDQAKLDLMSAYTLNSLFWAYLVTRGINPREHGIKQELERIRAYMNRVKEITDKKKAARLDKGAASRFIRSALYEPEDKDSKKKNESKKQADSSAEAPPPKRQKQRK